MKLATLDDYEDIIKIFYENRSIFPHIRTDYLKRMIESKKCFYKDGVVITFNQYKRTNKIGDVYANKNSYTIKQIVNKHKGNGKAAEILKEFLQSVQQPVYLSVRADNVRANSFYKKMNFELVGTINWKNGTIPGHVYLYSETTPRISTK
jgi:RimJ/RimL family protein N-acetyltransferase